MSRRRVPPLLAFAALLASAGAAASAAPAFSPRDLTGTWMGGGLPPLTFPYNAEYAALYKQRLADEAAGKPYDDPAGRCITSGMPAVMLIGAYPWQVFQSDKEVTMLKENGSVRRISLRRQKHDDGDAPTYMGDSIGHWEGDTLVVDTVWMRTNTVLERRVAPHSDAMRIVERISRPAYDKLQNVMTIEDPKAFTKPWTVTVTLQRQDDWELREFICQDNNRFIRLPDGTVAESGVQR